MSAAKQWTVNQGDCRQKDFDQLFLNLLQQLSEQALEKAAQCTSEILQISDDFLSRNASETLRKFYDLYFSKGLDEKKEEVNKEVDDIFDQVQNNLAEGKDASDGLAVNEASEQKRLGLSGLQKQLEGLITLDEGIKEKIFPALSAMQFEDAVRQRLEHIVAIWQTTFTALAEKGESLDIKQHAKGMADIMTSVEETKIYYEIVLKEEPPEGGVNAGEALLFSPKESL